MGCYCVLPGSDGNKFLIEVQRAYQRNFGQRAAAYMSRLILDQVPKGSIRISRYNIHSVYFIAILEGFTFIESNSSYLNRYSAMNEETGELFFYDYRFIFIELPKFVKSESDLESNLDKWVYLLKNMGRLKKPTGTFKDSIFDKLFALAEYTNLTMEEKIMYDNWDKRKWDNEEIIASAEEKGIVIGEKKGIVIGEKKGIIIGEKKGIVIGEKKGIVIGEKKGIIIGEKKGIVIGEKKGIVIGEKKGIVIGEKKGKEKEKRALALKMKNQGYSNQVIADLIEFPIESIEKL